MRRFDRYILSQLLVLFGFFALVLVMVFWVNRTVVLFDKLMADGHGIGIFLEFTALSLPGVVIKVLPVAAFAAAVYATNRLNNESELTVMQATGFSPWRLVRPVVFFGLIAATMTFMLATVLEPAANARSTIREREISENLTARLLSEGTFMHPTRGVTFFIREITPEGELRDIFLSDQRDPENAATFTAQKSYLVKSDTGAKLIMTQGMAQYHSESTERLFVTRFDDFTYDISALINTNKGDTRRLGEIDNFELLANQSAIQQELDIAPGRITHTIHSRFNLPIMSLVAAILGFATLLSGGFSRFGVWKQVVIAFVLLVFLEMIKNAVADPVRKSADLWFLAYLPSVIGAAITALLLQITARPIRLRRRPREATS